ncbi:tim-barrel fold metal-dependent hydrolase [Halosimplex carlsbadense 2-9-1]|uniref:Tim-barrel fold metal-dependent hydrolase n=1 Tax=Halosimplex carlsbadense 2-9-1 TaxID=797114 RepID=M0CYA8_9EURY|nr:amidohydrolase [Halosimplex carlsbadense]ELZ28205.1 tim-barrel fold metal-dependent hydrolase [Halosimplex carlsbadense 2-9-1]
MTAAADLVFTNAEIHTLADPDERAEALAVRDGRIVAVGSAFDVEHLAGVETTVRDCEGRVVLPGFIDAHTHLPMVGRRLVNADLSAAGSPAEAVDLLAARAAELEAEDGPDREWVLGFGYDESAWADDRYLTAADLDEVSTDRPVAAVREDMHLGSLDSVALDRLRGRMPDADVRTRADEPTGVVVEDALDALWEAIEPDRAAMRRAVDAAAERAAELGVVGVHDMVRRSEVPAVYRELDRVGALGLRVRLNYWSDHLDAVAELGLRTNHGSDRVRVGAIKTYTDGSIGGRTAKLSEPYADAERAEADSGGSDRDPRGQWVVDPEELGELVTRADAADLQVAVHAIGDEAIRETLDALESADGVRHRIEHAEVLTDELVERIAGSDVVASMQPNFLKWARADGLYAARLGEGRRLASNRFSDLLDAGADLAFGSDCMPLDPLYGIQQAVTAPDERQRLSVTEALRAYTSGAAYAGFDEDRLGTVEPGKLADLVVLDRSPWDADLGEIADIDVRATVVGGEVVFDRDGAR